MNGEWRMAKGVRVIGIHPRINYSGGVRAQEDTTVSAHVSAHIQNNFFTQDRRIDG